MNGMSLAFYALLFPQALLAILHPSLGNQCGGVTAHRGTPPFCDAGAALLRQKEPAIQGEAEVVISGQV